MPALPLEVPSEPEPEPEPGPSWFLPVESLQQVTATLTATSTVTCPATPTLQARSASTGVLQTTRPSLHTRPASTPVTAATTVAAPSRSRSRSPLVTTVRTQRRKRYSRTDADAEESALFQKWLASDIAKNETKAALMQLQITKLQRELE